MREALSSLVVGERVISQCGDGLLAAEYALFDPAEVMLSGATGQGVRELGYLTTAGTARERLAADGVNAQLARDTFSALRRRHIRALARSASVLRAIEALGPYEAFEGGTFSAESQTYQGTWLDMAALASACPLRGAAILLQAIHLSQVIDEISDDVPVRLLTVNATARLRSGARTWTKVPLETARRLPSVLRAMRVPSRSKAEAGDDFEVREELLRGLRVRSAVSKVSNPRIRSLATAVARTGNTDPPAPPTEPDVARPRPLSSKPPVSIEAQIAEGVSAGTDPMALFEELRGHTQLLRGEDHLRAVAHFLTGMSERAPSRPELGVLASRAWLAAGEPGHARHLSQKVADDPAAEDDVRLLALEILESTAEGEASLPAPSDAPPIIPMPILMAVPHEQFAPVGASLPPYASEPASKVNHAAGPIPSATFAAGPIPSATFAAGPPRVQDRVTIQLPADEPSVTLAPHTALVLRKTPPPIVATTVVIVDAPPASTPTPRMAPMPAPTPIPATAPMPTRQNRPVPRTTVKLATPRPPRPTATPAPPPPTPLPPPASYGAPAPVSPPYPGQPARSEIVESLSLPPGLTEEMLPAGAKPQTPVEARIAMTRLSRTLGRDYRLWYGTTLVTNAIAVETMQRHLRRRFEDASSDKQTAQKLEAELTRHGALLSEILARSLGAAWVDLSASEPGHWAMVIHPNTRVWPIGRVYRFFQQGHREADLVAFFLDLESEARRT